MALKIRPKSVFGQGSDPDPVGELTTTLPNLYSLDTPPHTQPHSAPTHFRRSPCVPQNSSQIYAYANKGRIEVTGASLDIRSC